MGAPLLRGKKMDELLANRCSELDIALGRLSLLAAHDALILLKASFSAPKMLHTLRCSNHPNLAVFDDFVRKKASVRFVIWIFLIPSGFKQVYQ